MKKTILSLGILCTSLLQAQTDVRFSINHLFNSNPFELNTTLTNSSQEEMDIIRLEYYISDVSLTHDGGQVTVVPDAYVLVNAEAGTNISLGNFPITNLESIEFGIGVSADVNHDDPTLYNSTHALAPKIPSMHWGWASGYRFIALEGNSGMNLGTDYEFHALGDANFQKQIVITSGVNSGSMLTVALDADYYNAFNSIPVSNGPIKHGESYPECLQLIDNFKTSVFTESMSAPVSIEENASVDITLYPNPVSDAFKVNLSANINSATTYKIVDQLGRIIKQDKWIKGQSISTLEFSNGVYFIEIQSASHSIAKQSFIVNK